MASSASGSSIAAATISATDVAHSVDRNVLGTALKQCPGPHKSGFYRTGFCSTGPEDHGSHVVAAIVTEEFLEYTKAQGNDLSTPRPQWGFPGLKPGDGWCLCAMRWAEAEAAGKAPKVVLEATHEKAARMVSMDKLEAHAVTVEEDTADTGL